MRSIANPFVWSFFLNSSTNISASFSLSEGKNIENRDITDSDRLTALLLFARENWLANGQLILSRSSWGYFHTYGSNTDNVNTVVKKNGAAIAS